MCSGVLCQPLARVIWFKDIYDPVSESLPSRQCCFLCSLAEKPTDKKKWCVFCQGVGRLLSKFWKRSAMSTPFCFPRIPHWAGALRRVLLVLISDSSLRPSRAIIRSHLAESMGPASLWNAFLSLRMGTCQYGQLTPEGREVFAPELVLLDTYEVESQT